MGFFERSDVSGIISGIGKSYIIHSTRVLPGRVPYSGSRGEQDIVAYCAMGNTPDVKSIQIYERGMISKEIYVIKLG